MMGGRGGVTLVERAHRAQGAAGGKTDRPGDVDQTVDARLLLKKTDEPLIEYARRWSARRRAATSRRAVAAAR
jgi:hypothetical protein